MRVYAQPAERHVRRLLAAADLPAADLTPTLLAHFLACGSEHDPDGVIGLEPLGSVALLRSLAVDARARGRGCGRALVAAAERYAQQRGIDAIFLLTTTAESFFGRLGYRVIARSDAPEAVRATRQFAELCSATSTIMTKSLAEHQAT